MSDRRRRCQVPVRLAISGLLALCIIAVPASLEAKYSPETPGEILTMRGMPMTLGVCFLGSVVLGLLPVPRAGSLPPPIVPAPRRAAWLLLILFVLFIFATIPVGFQIAAGIVARIGHDAWTYTIDVAGGVLVLLFLRYVFRQRELRHWSVVAWMVGIAALYGYFFAVLEVPVKRIHFMEYSFLSYLVFRALRPHSEPPSIYLWCVLVALLVGSAEETLSLLHPRRFGAVSDVIWDTGGGSLGALALKYVLLER